MVSGSALRLAAALIASVPAGLGAAQAARSLADAVKQADGKYLGAPDIEWTNDAPTIEAGGGEEEGPPAPQEIAQGPLRVVLSYRQDARDDEEPISIPVVTVFADGKEVARIEGEDIGFPDPPVSVQIAEIDPANAHPEVVVSFYTGGAHCCSDTSVLTANADGTRWTTVDVGEFDGGPLLATDLDGDGRYEIATRDNAFLYAFACYACSEAPLQVIGVEGAEVKNVTEDPRYRPAHISWLKQMIETVPEDDINGFLAGYVGEKILLGEGKQAWELMLEYYDRASDWGLTACNVQLDDEGNCPGKEITLSFPDALEHMLKENGYKVEN
jgi:hypothetical protein